MREVSHEGNLGHELLLALDLEGLLVVAGRNWGHWGIPLGIRVFEVILGEHDVKPIVDDTRQLRILDERNLVDVLLLVAPHQEIFVEVC